MGGQGAIRYETKEVTAAYTVKLNDACILCNGTFTVTLPLLASSKLGKLITVKNISTGVITIDGAGEETIEGDLTQELYESESFQLVAGSSDWSVT